MNEHAASPQNEEDTMTLRVEEVTAGDVWRWMLENGFESAESDQWGEVAYRCGHHATAIQKTHSAFVMLGDLAHALNAPRPLLHQAVRAGWSFDKTLMAMEESS